MTAAQLGCGCCLNLTEHGFAVTITEDTAIARLAGLPEAAMEAAAVVSCLLIRPAPTWRWPIGRWHYGDKIGRIRVLIGQIRIWG
jgi:hypothetical protein